MGILGLFRIERQPQQPQTAFDLPEWPVRRSQRMQEAIEREGWGGRHIDIAIDEHTKRIARSLA